MGFVRARAARGSAGRRPHCEVRRGVVRRPGCPCPGCSERRERTRFPAGTVRLCRLPAPAGGTASCARPSRAGSSEGAARARGGREAAGPNGRGVLPPRLGAALRCGGSSEGGGRGGGASGALLGPGAGLTPRGERGGVVSACGRAGGLAGDRLLLVLAGTGCCGGTPGK